MQITSKTSLSLTWFFAAALSVTASAATAQSLLDRVQGLYYPDLPGTTWNCTALGSDGGAVGIRGNQILGVESACTLNDPFPIPGMDAIRFTQSCAGEGMTWDGGPVIITPTDRGVFLLSEGFGVEWLRCPG